jgi:xylulokinase
VAEACAATVRVAEVIEPKHIDIMAAGYNEYRKIYPALKSVGRN